MIERRINPYCWRKRSLQALPLLKDACWVLGNQKPFALELHMLLKCLGRVDSMHGPSSEKVLRQAQLKFWALHVEGRTLGVGHGALHKFEVATHGGCLMLVSA